MDARHCAGTEMSEMMAYAASVGSDAAKKELKARGFVGSANDATSPYFGSRLGIGTMPHAFVGYAGSTLRAAEMYNEAFPKDDLTVLVDYFGREIKDSIEVCERFPGLANSGKLAIRLDTHGGRYIEGLDVAHIHLRYIWPLPKNLEGLQDSGLSIKNLTEGLLKIDNDPSLEFQSDSTKVDITKPLIDQFDEWIERRWANFIKHWTEDGNNLEDEFKFQAKQWRSIGAKDTKPFTPNP